MKTPKVYIILPCFNEEQVLPETVKRLCALVDDLARENMLSIDSRITLVDDGSRDDTWDVITNSSAQYPCIEGLKLAHNVGHQNALWAGMMTVREHADAIISIDADLQDDIGAIREMLFAFQNGNEIVYGVRSSRKTDTAFKRKTAHFYYDFMRFMGAKIVYDHADYRLIGRRALDALSEFGEVNLFLRGMVPLLGFQQCEVYYERGERFAGESKYPLKKMLAFAMEGLTSFSIKPIRYVTIVGGLFSLIGVIMAIYALISHFTGHTVPGWSSMIVSIWVIGGVQLMALGLIGEYIGKIYTEVKKRPRFIVETYLQKQTTDKTFKTIEE